ncbi:MAG: LptF/LptG family permease [Elusimicrobiota bacterium]
MSIFSRYVLKRFFPAFLACLAALIMILFMNKLARLIAVAALKGASPAWIVACFGLLLPYFLTLTLPAAFLLASMVTMDRLAVDGELLAARLAGFSFFELTWPLAALSLLLSVSMLGLDHWGAPAGLRRFRARYSDVSRGLSRLEPGVLSPFGNGKIRVRAVDSKTGELRGVDLFAKRDDRWLIVTAPRADFIGAGVEETLVLRDGQLQLPDTEELVRGNFSRLLVPLHPTAAPLTPGEDSREMPSGELLSRARGYDAGSETGRAYATEVSVRSAAASAPFVFFWLAVPIFFLLRPGQRGRGFAGGIVVLFVFYSLLAAGVVLSRRGGGRVGALFPWLGTAAGLAAGIPLVWNCFF